MQLYDWLWLMGQKVIIYGVCVWIRLIVGFQPLMVISPTASWCGVCRCMRGDLMWTCLVWAERSTPDNFWVPSHWFNSATGEQKESLGPDHTDPEPPSRMPNSLMPSAKLKWKAHIILCLWCDAVGDWTPAFRTPSRCSNHYAMPGPVLKDCPLATKIYDFCNFNGALKSELKIVDFQTMVIM